MNYKNKYIKYKEKYLIIKNQIGNGIEDYRAPTCYTDERYKKKIVGCNINFTNKLGTCWALSILIIFLYSDSSSKCVQNILTNIPVENIIADPIATHLLECALPDSIIDNPYKDKLKLLIEKLKEKFDIKIKDKTLNIPDVTEKEFVELYFNLINDTSMITCGGKEYHDFFLINILSSLFLKKLVEKKCFGINKLINLELLKNTIGIMISMPDHQCSFYICSNKMKFCNNSLIIDYNWLELFKTCNRLKLENKNYNIYINILNKKGPFIYIDNKIIYFDKDEPYIKKEKINYNNDEKYYEIEEFQFICCRDNEENFKKTNYIYYLHYHTYVYDIVKYKEFIIKYNISINDINKPIVDTNNSHITLFNIACNRGRIEIVELLLQYPGINVTGSLHIGYRHIEIVKLLLQHRDIDINKTIDYIMDDKKMKNISVLYIACKRGRFDIVELLLQYRYINVNPTSKEGDTPLYIACYKGHDEIVELLLRHRNIDVNKANNNEFTPLYIACNEGDDDIVKLLLQHHSIDINKGIPPLYIACLKGHDDIVKLLLHRRTINVNKANEIGFTPLYIACNEGHLDVVKLLLKHHEIKINIQDNDNETPLHIACNQGYDNIVEFLLQRSDIEINIQNNDHETPLHIACNQGHDNIVEFLLQRPDIEINIQNIDGDSSLHIACDLGYANIVELLLQQFDIEINIKNKNDDTPLLIATKKNRIDIIELLLQRPNIEINIPNNKGYTPLLIATQNNRIDIIELLNKYLK
jgi:ankyrin repeat protein